MSPSSQNIDTLMRAPAPTQSRVFQRLNFWCTSRITSLLVGAELRSMLDRSHHPLMHRNDAPILSLWITTLNKLKTMIQICKFNPLCDVEEVVPELAPDISEMMLTHTVPATSSVDTPYTNETDIHEVGHYLRDKIDIAMAQMRLNASLSEKAAKAAVSAESASAGVQSTANAGASA